MYDLLFRLGRLFRIVALFFCRNFENFPVILAIVSGFNITFVQTISHLTITIMSNKTKFVEPILIKAGDTRVKLGVNSVPPLVDSRVIAEHNYQRLYKCFKNTELIGINSEAVELLYQVAKKFGEFDDVEVGSDDWYNLAENHLALQEEAILKAQL